MRIGLFGGCFNPVHRGHLAAAMAARSVLRLDRVIFIPTGQPPLANARALAPAQHRLAMVRLAIAGLPGCAVSDSEVNRPGPSYSVETARELRAAMPGDHAWFFLLGQDCLPNLPRWKGIDELHAMLRFAILRRGPGGLPPFEDKRYLGVSMTADECSSTAVRTALADGRSIGGLVPESVAEYICDHGLYTLAEEPVDA